jgi:hypothetical protein
MLGTKLSEFGWNCGSISEEAGNMEENPEVGGAGVSPTAAVLSGVIAGLLVVFIGVVARQFGEPFPGASPLGPSIAGVAAGLAAAVATYRSGSPIGAALALAVGAFVVTYFISVWLTHWVAVGGMVRRRPMDPVVLGWRRDLSVCFLGIAVGSFLGAFLGRR